MDKTKEKGVEVPRLEVAMIVPRGRRIPGILDLAVPESASLEKRGRDDGPLLVLALSVSTELSGMSGWVLSGTKLVCTYDLMSSICGLDETYTEPTHDNEL